MFEESERELLQIPPNGEKYDAALDQLLRVQIALGRYGPALETGKLLLARNEDFTQAAYNASIASSLLGRLEEARDFLKRLPNLGRYPGEAYQMACIESR
ncbi:MAG: hypothetical protein QOD99_1045, partial [Chthoniobacter sp.]|nr:hypothetical protein [Chthoniobacter sp.]